MEGRKKRGNILDGPYSTHDLPKIAQVRSGREFRLWDRCRGELIESSLRYDDDVRRGRRPKREEE